MICIISGIVSCWPAFCHVWNIRILIYWLIDEPSNIDDYNDMPTEHVISLEYLTYFIVLHCVLAAFCQLLLNEYCILYIVLYWSGRTKHSSTLTKLLIRDMHKHRREKWHRWTQRPASYGRAHRCHRQDILMRQRLQKCARKADDYQLILGTEPNRELMKTQKRKRTVRHQRAKQKAQLMLTNPRDAFRGQSRSPSIVPVLMLGIVSY